MIDTAVAMNGARARRVSLWIVLMIGVGGGFFLIGTLVGREGAAAQDLAALAMGALPDCPPGYARETAENAPWSCRAGNDVMVRVGVGATSFWIDRYEASVWSEPLGAGQQFGEWRPGGNPDYPSTFPPNGQWSAPLFAASREGVLPSISLTWFQADEACRASGKRLPTRAEWLTAARGTPDSSKPSGGASGTCVTAAEQPHKTGEGPVCVSSAGAQDMIGNVWEWVDEWYAGLGDASAVFSIWLRPGFGQDGIWNVSSSAYPGAAPPVRGLPVAAARGGLWFDETRAGIHALMLDNAPSNAGMEYGFRCVVPR